MDPIIIIKYYLLIGVFIGMFMSIIVGSKESEISLLAHAITIIVFAVSWGPQLIYSLIIKKK